MPNSAEELSDAIRDLVEVVRTADVNEADLDTLTARVRSVANEIRPHVVDEMRMQATLRYDQFVDVVAAQAENIEGVDEYTRDGSRDPSDFFPYSPIVGRLNPVAPPVKMWRVPGETHGEIHGSATFGAAYNGPPGCVHGGVIAATLDELLGSVCVVNGLGGFTGTLTVVYRSPTPLSVPLTMRGWYDRTEGRKIFVRGELHHGSTLCAEVEGIFIRSATLPGGGVPPNGL